VHRVVGMCDSACGAGDTDAVSCAGDGWAGTQQCLRHIPRRCYHRDAGTVGTLGSLFL